MGLTTDDTQYTKTLGVIKQRVYKAKYQAMQRINSELVSMYWDIGKIIAVKQKQQNWGDSVVETIAKDLQAEFQGRGDFSRRNVFRMRSFYLAYVDNKKVRQLVAQIGWGHHDFIMRKTKSPLAREFYIRASIAGKWSRNTLLEKIKHNEYENWATSQSNFSSISDKSISTKADNLIKDQVDLSMLNLQEDHNESQLEDKIVKNITAFLTQMGGQFAFIGRQFEIILKERTYKIDLLFYHRSLNCLIAIELKTNVFKPEYAGKMNAYLAALDKYEKKPNEAPSVGIIICKSKDREEVELSLQFITKPIGVSTYTVYRTREDLPAELERYMPTDKDISRRLIGIK